MTTSEVPNPLAYYAHPGIMTDPGQYGALLDGLPTGIAELCEVVQGLLLHIFWAERYGVELPEARKQEVNLRAVSDKMAQILRLDDGPLTTARPLSARHPPPHAAQLAARVNPNADYSHITQHATRF